MRQQKSNDNVDIYQKLSRLYVTVAYIHMACGQNRCSPITVDKTCIYKRRIREEQSKEAGVGRRREKLIREEEQRIMSSKGKTVCVTGASGFVASWLVKLLLDRGYTVKASVRDPADPKKTEHLRLLDGAKERLQLYKADLLEENSFDAIVDGCEGVFHTATPVFFTAKEPEAELIEPAVKGTLNVLSSCSKTPTVKRVIVTSSTAACEYNRTPLTSDVVVDESWFSCPMFCRENKLWYHLSKTLAEEVAWKYSKEHGIDMIMIHPSFVVGPLLQPTLNATSDIILKIINGTTSTYPNGTYGWVNVKDVAKAHILAYEDPLASGRYCLAERVYHYSEVVKLLHELYPSLQLPQKCDDDKPFSPVYLISKEKAKSLGIEYIPLETSLKEIVESLKEKGFISF